MRHILWKKVQRGELTREEADIAARALEQVDLTIVSARGYLGLATSIAVELNHPAYDAVYLAVAEAFGLRVVTADGRLVRKARESHSRFRHMLVVLTEIE